MSILINIVWFDIHIEIKQDKKEEFPKYFEMI